MAVTTLDYDDTGAGPALVFVHGMTFSRRTWDPIVERLRARFHCLAVDLPGHGGSSGSGADQRAVADRINATVTAVGMARPVVIGHSAGALYATAYAANFPSAGVVNVDQTLRVGPFAGFVQQLAPALRGPDFDKAFAPFRDSIGIDALPEPERSRVTGTQRIDQQVVLDHWTTPMTSSPAQLQAEVDGLLDAIDVPYLWLSGNDVAELDRAALLTHLPTARIETWPGRGHMVHLAEPDRFAALVADFASTGASAN